MANADSEVKEKLARTTAMQQQCAVEESEHRARIATREVALQQRMAAAERQAAARETEVVARLERIEATHTQAVTETFLTETGLRLF